MRTADQAEARHARRFPIAVEVHVRPEQKDAREQMLLSHDWSEGGVFVRTRHPLVPGTVVELGVLVPELHAPVKTHGQVVRAVAPDLQDIDHPPGMGIRLFTLPDALAKYLSALAEEGRHPALHRASHRLLLVGGTVDRVRHAIHLDAMGFTVAEADDAEQAQAMLAHALDPDAVVIFADGTPELVPAVHAALRRTMPALPRIMVLGDTEQVLAEAAHVHASVTVPEQLPPERLFSMLSALLSPHRD